MSTQIKIKLPKIKVPKTKKSKAPVSLRTTKDELQYSKAKNKGITKSLLDEVRLREWKLWALIDNEFPYTAAFKTHHMLIPKRRVDDKNLSIDERIEMDEILNELSETYDCVLINFKKKQSIRDYFHMHLLIYKDKRKELKI
jgi:hypothetical protein